jgi:CheY-like chemotaxis protein
MAKNLSTFAIAKMLSVDPGSVANWIDRGLLNAHRTPGGHRRVLGDDLLSFLRSHKMPVPASLAGKQKRILVVDDEPAITQMITRAIKHSHPELEIGEAHDGFKAGTMVATFKPDVVILDLKMPGIDGFEVCKMVKSQQTTQHIEVLAMTAYPSSANKKRVLDCGARICLSKPLDMEGLIKEIENSLL